MKPLSPSAIELDRLGPAPLVRSRLIPLAASCGLVLCAFAVPLVRLGSAAWHSELLSYILVVPLIVAFFVWARRRAFADQSEPNRGVAAALVAAGTVAIGCRWFFRAELTELSALSVEVLAMVCWIAGASCFFLGRRAMALLGYPVAMLVLLAPPPPAFTEALEAFLQNSSAVVAEWFLEMSGMPVFRIGGTELRLPGMNLQVAPECSGLHSTLALFVLSLPVGFLFLKSPWKRAVLSAATLPLGIIRNGFRVWVIGQLCVRVGPEMIDSYIHRHGGWIFFILSLVPFGVLLFFLGRSRRRKDTVAVPSATPA